MIHVYGYKWKNDGLEEVVHMIRNKKSKSEVLNTEKSSAEVKTNGSETKNEVQMNLLLDNARDGSNVESDVTEDDNENLTELSESILFSVKKLIGIPQEDSSFDLDIMLHINAASSSLFQIGVLQKPYTVTSKNDTYSDLIPGGTEDVVNQIKMYFVYKVRLGFDSSTLSSAVIEVIKEMIREAEWRLMVSFNPIDAFE